MTETMSAMTTRSFTDEFPRAGQTDMPARATSGSAILSSKEWWSVFDDKKEVEIAQELKISAHTVHTYLGRLYRKLNVSSRAQLIVRVFAEYLAQFSENNDSMI